MENRSIIRKGIRVIEWLIIVLRNTIDSREVGKSAPCTHIFTDEFLPHRILILSGKAVNSDLILSFPFSFLPLSPSLPPLSLSPCLSLLFSGLLLLNVLFKIFLAFIQVLINQFQEEKGWVIAWSSLRFVVVGFSLFSCFSSLNL